MRHAVLAVLALAATPGFAQDDFSKVEVTVEKVGGNVYMLKGAGGNIGVSVGEDGIVIVDDEFLPLAPKIRAALSGITDKPVRFVLNTHWHGDHTGGNLAFGETAPIIAQENVRERLKAGGNIRGRSITPAPKGALPVITFENKVTVHLNGEDIRAIHFGKGHTDGDSIIYFTQSNVVHMGDDFVTYGFPFIDLESGGSVKGLIDSLHEILPSLPPGVKIIPGHGGVSGVEDVKKFEKMLEETYAIVQKGVQAGKSLEEMKNAKVLAAYDSWSGDFVKTDDFLETIFNDITNTRTPGTPTKHH